MPEVTDLDATQNGNPEEHPIDSLISGGMYHPVYFITSVTIGTPSNHSNIQINL